MGVSGCDREKEKEIPICIGTIDYCRRRGCYPKREKCGINSFSRAFRCNIDDLSMIYTARAISIQTVAFEKNHSVLAEMQGCI